MPFTSGGDGGGGTPAPGTDNALGAQLRLDLAALQSGQTLTLEDGVYQMVGSVDLPAGAALVAAPGARPIIIGGDEHPPGVNVRNGCTVRGVWFGGALSDDEKAIVIDSDVLVENCTFWNYYSGIVDGGLASNRLLNNRFVNCGRGVFYHSLYISNSLAEPGEGTLVEDCLFLGGEGYHLHLWHGPKYVVARRNFSASAEGVCVLNGDGHLFEDNVWWKPISPGYPINQSEGAGRTYTHNFHGPITVGDTMDGHPDWFGSRNFNVGLTASDNAYMQYSECDPDALQVATGDEAALLGQSAAAIDAAVAALEAAFAEPVVTIHADATLEPHFALLAGVVSTWAA